MDGPAGADRASPVGFPAGPGLPRWRPTTSRPSHRSGAAQRPAAFLLAGSGPGTGLARSVVHCADSSPGGAAPANYPSRRGDGPSRLGRRGRGRAGRGTPAPCPGPGWDRHQGGGGIPARSATERHGGGCHHHQHSPVCQAAANLVSASTQRTDNYSRRHPPAGKAGGRDCGFGKEVPDSQLTAQMKIGITCYPTYGGSGAVATELGLDLARRGHEVHFITYDSPFRLRGYAERVYFHQVETRMGRYPLFDHYPYTLALASKQHEVVLREELDLLHVHYAIPHATTAYLAREMLKRERSLKVITTLH